MLAAAAAAAAAAPSGSGNADPLPPLRRRPRRPPRLDYLRRHGVPPCFCGKKFHKSSRILIKIIYIILKFIFMYVIFITRIYIYIYIKKAQSCCFNRSKQTPSRHGNRCGSYGADMVQLIDQYLTAVHASRIPISLMLITFITSVLLLYY